MVPNPPKVELPFFEGYRPQEWIRKCEKYFLVHQIPELQKVEIVEMYLEGMAEIWFQGIKRSKGKLSKEGFCKLFCWMFGDRTKRMKWKSSINSTNYHYQ